MAVIVGWTDIWWGMTMELSVLLRQQPKLQCHRNFRRTVTHVKFTQLTSNHHHTPVVETMAGLPPKPPPTLPANQTYVIIKYAAKTLLIFTRLYVSHLPDKIQKQDLRRELYILFATYGSILDIVAMKTMKMRGQAHITYKDVATAARAMRELQGFEFFGQEIVCSSPAHKNTPALLTL